MAKVNKKYVTASEIGEFIYCRNCWWKQTHGLLEKNEEMIEGSKLHEEILTTINSVETDSDLGKRLLIIGLSLLLIYLLFHFIHII